MEESTDTLSLENFDDISTGKATFIIKKTKK